MNLYHRLVLAVGLGGATLSAAPLAFPCTTFLAHHAGQPIVGKNYDWTQGAALVVTNPRGLAKTALVLEPNASPAAWTSRYASLTFNQYGVEFPNGGMNEKGLVIEIMWLDSSVYPAPNALPVVNELAWIQHGLDNFATVEELASAAPAVRVSQAYAKVHYLACDATSDCAAFEYIGGQLVVTRSKDMPAKTLANSTYSQSATYLAGFEGFGGTQKQPTTSSSLDRFARASMLATTSDATTIPTSAFAILDSVAQTTTQWSIVYSLKQGEVAFRTKGVPAVKTVRLGGLVGDCSAGRKVLSISTNATGDVGALFMAYATTSNRQLLETTMGPLAAQLPTGALDLVAAYPETCTCRVSPEGGTADDGGASLGDSGGDRAVGEDAQPLNEGGVREAGMPDAGTDAASLEGGAGGAGGIGAPGAGGSAAGAGAAGVGGAGQATAGASGTDAGQGAGSTTSASCSCRLTRQTTGLGMVAAVGPAGVALLALMRRRKRQA